MFDATAHSTPTTSAAQATRKSLELLNQRLHEATNLREQMWLATEILPDMMQHVIDRRLCRLRTTESSHSCCSSIEEQTDLALKIKFRCSCISSRNDQQKELKDFVSSYLSQNQKCENCPGQKTLEQIESLNH